MRMRVHRIDVIAEPEFLLRRHGSDLLGDERLLALVNNHHHRSSNTYAHCVSVALVALTLARKHRIRVDIRSLVRACLLHDYYGYDNDHKPKRHLRTHPFAAFKNADRDFGINGVEHDIIVNHMWPIHPFLFPLTREGWLCCLADKIVAIREWHNRHKKKAS